ncbi:MAG: ABC transporter permease [Arsenophonus sp.]|nr:MAG: ABC transporter permease [Arsenophonus sp.]
MHYFVVFFISYRYIFKQIEDKFARFLSILSTISFALGVLILIIVTSIMTGFERSLQDNILSYMSQVILTTLNGNLNPNILTKEKIKHLKGIKNITSIVQSDVIIQSDYDVSFGIMMGINDIHSDPIYKHINVFKDISLNDGDYYIFLGYELAEKLQVKLGDYIRIIIPNVMRLTPIGHIPSQRLFKIAGFFSTYTEIDTNTIIVNQNDAARLMCYPDGYITGWRLFLNFPLKVHILSNQKLPENLIWTDWREKKGEFFQAVRMEKNMLGLLLSLIIGISCFNIISSVVLIVIQKKIEIAILWTLGLNRIKIMFIFILKGIWTSIVGIISGTILGILISLYLNKIIVLFGFFSDSIVLPIVIDIQNIIMIIILSIMLSFIAAIYPAWYASRIYPAKVFRYV